MDDREVMRLERELVGLRIDGYFPTPRGLAEHMVWLAGVRGYEAVWEPSAGAGAIADAIRDAAPNANLSVCEACPRLRAILEAKGHNVVGSDCMEHTGSYAAVLMNPPFERGHDMEHARHAYDQLVEGGALVAIMCEGPFFREDRQSVEFREWLDEVGGVTFRLPDGTFDRGDRPTRVSTRLVAIGVPNAERRIAITLEEIEAADARRRVVWAPPCEERTYASPTAKRIAKAAAGMDAAIARKRTSSQPMQRLTPRRARMASGAANEAERLERVQRLLRALADAHERGECPAELESVRNRTEVEDLLGRRNYLGPWAYTHAIRWALDALPEAERYEPRAVRLRRLSTDAHLRDCARCDLPTEADVDAAEWLAKTADTRDPSRAADILVPIRDYRRLRKLGITDQASLDRAREALNRVGGAE